MKWVKIQGCCAEPLKLGGNDKLVGPFCPALSSLKSFRKRPWGCKAVPKQFNSLVHWLWKHAYLYSKGNSTREERLWVTPAGGFLLSAPVPPAIYKPGSRGPPNQMTEGERNGFHKTRTQILAPGEWLELLPHLSELFLKVIIISFPIQGCGDN